MKAQPKLVPIILFFLKNILINRRKWRTWPSPKILGGGMLSFSIVLYEWPNDLVPSTIFLKWPAAFLIYFAYFLINL